MIAFDAVNIETIKALSFSVDSGKLVKIITKTVHEKDILLDVMAGLRKPESGNVSILEKNIYSPAITENEIIQLYQDIGIIWQEGGLISNLQIWENIVLPVEYHTEKAVIEYEDEVRDILKKLGSSGEKLASRITKLPAHLPRYQKILACLIKVMLMKPQLVIYDAIFSTLDSGVSKNVATVTYDFHAEHAKRISIYLDSNENRLSHIKADIVIKQQDTGWSLSKETA